MVVIVVLGSGAAIAGGIQEILIPPEKQARLETEAARASANAKPPAPRPEDPSVERPPAAEPAAWPTGIFDDGESPNGSLITVTTRWVEKVSDGYLVVYVGNAPDVVAKGVVVAMRFDVWGVPLEPAVVRETSEEHGSLTIVGAGPEGLKLLAADGTTYSFEPSTATLTAQ